MRLHHLLPLTMLLLATLLAGCATREEATPGARPDNCPAKVGGYVVGETTATFVMQCLGDPQKVENNPDGRYAYFYTFKDTVVAFIFDSQGKLLRTRGFKPPAQ